MSLRKLLSHTVLAYPRTMLIAAILLTLLSVWAAIVRLSFTSTHEALSPLSGRVGQLQRQYNQAFGDPDRAVIVVEAKDREQATRYAAVLAGRLEALAGIEPPVTTDPPRDQRGVGRSSVHRLSGRGRGRSQASRGAHASCGPAHAPRGPARRSP